MIDCEDVLFSRRVDAAGRDAHVAVCPRCAADAAAIRRVAGALGADVASVPPPALAARVHRAAGPLLARNARRAAWPAVGRALAAALLLLPLIVFVDVQALRAAYAVLTHVLPGGLGAYVVFNHAATLTLLLGIAYGAIPILAERQVRLRRKESHG